MVIIVMGMAISIFTACSSDSSDSSSTTSTTTSPTTETSDCVSVTPTYDYTIVDTNQTLCYDSSTGSSVTCTGTGQDGQYSGNQPSYSLCNDNTVVVDNITGLMWKASSDVDGVSGLNVDDKKTRANAATYCDDLTYGTYSDWRLPTIKELFSIYLFSGRDISGMTGAASNGTAVDTTGVDPFIDTNYFDVGYGDTDSNERKIDGQYATSTLNISQVMSGISETVVDAFFGLNFVDGHLKSYEADVTANNDADYYVRCVRGSSTYGTNDFVANGDGVTISDNATNLMWEKGDSTSTDFDDALSVCETATTGSFSDWRLPNIKELHSIIDYTKSPSGTSTPSIDATYFTSTSFTNEAGNADWGYYWSSSALLDYQGDGSKGGYITFGRGLGYINGVEDVHGAGAQRSDYKKTAGRDADSITSFSVDGSCTFGTTGYRKGPQGDILRVENNYVRCVRDK